MEETATANLPGYIAISLVDLAFTLVTAIAIGLLTVAVYRLTHRGFHYERSFLTTLVMMPSVVATVMMLIGSNLALSLGMVGALSIIRFRTVVKDSRDMVYLFLAIAAGLGCGTSNWSVALISTVSLLAFMLALSLIRFGKPMHADYVLVLNGETAYPSMDALKDELQPSFNYLELRSMSMNDQSWELVFEARLPRETNFPDSELIERLKADFGVQQLSVLAPQLAIPV